IVGESGSGKSLTAKALMGLLPPTADISRGKALFRGPNGLADIAEMDAPALQMLRGKQIAMIFQEPMSSLSPFHTIGAQVQEALRLHFGTGGRRARERVLQEFEHVGFPNPIRAYNAYPFELSGGLRQRAMIAMAMICRPQILIADEPTTALDVSTQAVILELIDRLRAETGMSVLLITHDLGIVANSARFVTVFNKGRVMEAGETADILTSPEHPYTQRLIAAAPTLDATLATKRDTGPDPVPGRPNAPDLILWGHDIEKTYESRSGGIWNKQETIHALTGVDFRLPRGKTLALVGESGSGKTTLAKIAMHAETADPGATILYDPGDGSCGGKGPVSVTELEGAELRAFRRQVQMVFQDPFASLSPRMTVHDILCEPLEIHAVDIPELTKPKERTQRAAALLRRVGLPEEALQRFPHAFSGGQRQRISIARALALEPRLLICDEPTSALDVSVQAQVLDLLETLQSEMGLSYLFISHDLAVVARLADEIAVMCRGTVVERAPTERLFKAPQHPYTQALMAAVPEPDPTKLLDIATVAKGAGAEPE
ncbi:MAG: ABC transporter ATP-binding protein, partial [Pseudomonadota bacterium]